MKVYRFSHPNQPDWTFSWDLNTGLLESSKGKASFVEAGTKVGRLLSRFIKYRMLDSSGYPSQDHEQEDLDPIEVRFYRRRLLGDVLDLPKTDWELFISNIRGVGYTWNVALSHFEGAKVTGESPKLHEASPVAYCDDHVTRSQRIRLARLREDFCGREWLRYSLIDFIEKHDRGVFWVVGEPGIGKSAFSAHIAGDHHYPCFFFSKNYGEQDEQQAVECLWDQLNEKGLQDSDRVPPGCLHQLLNGGYFSSDDPLVLILDAFDEAVDVRGQIPRLPAHLPTNVYVLLTTRGSDDFVLGTRDPWVKITLAADDPKNLRDLETYKDQMLQRESVRMRLARGYGYEFLQDPGRMAMKVLLDQANGSFIYVVEYFRQFHDGLEPELPPRGLFGFHEECLARMKAASGEQWFKDLSLLVLLVENRGPFSPAKVAESMSEPHELRRILSRWRPFLKRIENETGERCFDLFHPSFKEFIRGREEWTDAAAVQIPLLKSTADKLE